jgi:hypothetical protein
MLKGLKHITRVVHAVIREHVIKNVTRSGKWPAARKAWLQEHPTCAACGGTTLRQVHHVDPFADDPAKELDPKNFITACMGPLECHCVVFHGDNFKFYNPNVRADAAEALAHPERFAEIALRAKANRVHSAGAS